MKADKKTGGTHGRPSRKSSTAMTRPIVRFVGAALLGLGLLTIPVSAAPEDMLTAIYDLDVDAVEDMVRDGEPVDETYYRNVLEVAGIMSESEPREVWWRARLMDITSMLANQSEPDDATFETLKDALLPDAEGQAAMDLQRSLNVFVSTEGRSGDGFERHLARGADPLLRPARGDFPDMFGYLIHLAQQMTEEAERMQDGRTDLIQAVEHAWREMRSYADAPHPARDYLDAALTPVGESIEYSSDIDGDPVRLAVRMGIDVAVLDMFDEVFSDATDIGAPNEDSDTASINWAREYAEAIEEWR